MEQHTWGNGSRTRVGNAFAHPCSRGSTLCKGQSSRHGKVPACSGRLALPGMLSLFAFIEPDWMAFPLQTVGCCPGRDPLSGMKALSWMICSMATVWRCMSGSWLCTRRPKLKHVPKRQYCKSRANWGAYLSRRHCPPHTSLLHSRSRPTRMRSFAFMTPLISRALEHAWMRQTQRCLRRTWRGSKPMSIARPCNNPPPPPNKRNKARTLLLR